MNFYWSLFLVVFVTPFGESANILYVIPFTSKSHYIMLRPIGLELARRGHNVTVITANKEENPPPNYHEVMVDDKKIWEVIGGERPNVFTMVQLSAERFHGNILWNGGVAFTEVTLNSTKVKSFLKQDIKFDLVICEQFFQEALYALAHKYNAPLVLVTTFGNCMRHNILVRNPLQLATTVSEFLDIEKPGSFWGRLRNLYFTAYEFLWWKFWYMEKQEDLVKTYIFNLPQPVPSLFEIQKNSSLILLNSHFSYDVPMALLPNVVEVGGLHLTKTEKSLPKDLQKLLDESHHGVVYVNFGSNVQSNELPAEKRDAFLNVFRKLKQTVLWKWEDDSLKDAPSNLAVRPWLPQKEILAHPNIKLFISHGGLIGTQEAIYNGIPIIGIPIYADQFNNLLIAEERGFGKILRFQDIKENRLEQLIKDVLHNKTYAVNAKLISERFKDRPLNALDTAMYWLEFVIRYKGAEFIKNPARHMTWMGYNMLDVYAFILMVLVGAVSIILYAVLHLTHMLRFNNVSKQKKMN
ncbi:unnamed protein product [Pieris brassicae]|uniref:UDP-glucuronosyltransferase n=1 Tax=Pieris brassicae TaxID=7116 RepID=A0A9P0T9R5_PIEBR|nr:unnamed protein product [Pieris brassicae]